jgi:hypothetical protein
LNSKGEGQEKRARRVATRPEPTIYGNCDSWSFIVGKKPGAYSRRCHQNRPLQVSNKKLNHRLLTIIDLIRGDKLWAICGPAGERPDSRQLGGLTSPPYTFKSSLSLLILSK